MSVSKSQPIAVPGHYQTPAIGVPFLQAFRVDYGPSGLLGRFYLNANQRLKEGGITLEFISFEELLETYLQNKATWGELIPIFDPRKSDVPPEHAICLAARDAKGRIVTCTSGRRYDLVEGETLRTIVEDGSFFGIGPDRADWCEITAPKASELMGRLVYCGGLWVDPEYRGFRLASMFPRLVHSVALAIWNADIVLGLVKPDAIGTGVHQRYGYSSFEASFRYFENNQLFYDGLLVWMSSDELIGDIARALDVLWPQINPRAIAGDAQQLA